MKYLKRREILLLNSLIFIFLLGCTKKVERITLLPSLNTLEKESYTVQSKESYHQIQYVGNWSHMTIEKNGKTGSFANTNLDTAIFRFWGYGIQVRTELMDNLRSYDVILDGVFMETINIQSDVNTTYNLTYSYMELKALKPNDHNHIIKLVPNGGYFVLNSLTIHYYIDPTPDLDNIDTVYIETIDTVYIETIDTVYIDKIDTVYIPKIDTVYIPKIDTVLYLLTPIFQYDTLKIK